VRSLSTLLPIPLKKSVAHSREFDTETYKTFNCKALNMGLFAHSILNDGSFHLRTTKGMGNFPDRRHSALVLTAITDAPKLLTRLPWRCLCVICV
jgi:hypothetical protein